MNVHHGKGMDGRVDLERTARVLALTRAKFFALQELDRNLERSGLTDQPELLAGMLGLSVHFKPTLKRGVGEYGIAVAAEGLGEITYEDLPRYGDEEPRGVLVVAWQGFTVLTTHLSQMRAARRRQVDFLVDLARKSTPPVLVLGDLNTGYFGLRPLRRAGFRGHGLRRTTERGWPRRIDHVLAGPGAAVPSTEVFSQGASDHAAVAAEVVRTR